ncbi:MAG: preprotein translocase subunit SecG [Flavobacteriaceae bacterium]|nr:preprotein translocase subunit SecG [Flavobacteriaceae bacterium]
MISGTFILLMIVIMAICVMLVMVILSQNPKGGGLSSTFGGGGSQMFGVQRTNDFLDKTTWTLAAIIAGMVILSNVMIPRGSTSALPDIPLQQLPTTGEMTPAPADGTTTVPAPATEPATSPVE